MTRKELNSIRLKVHYLSKYSRTYERNGRLLEYKDFKSVENIVKNWINEQKTLNIGDNLTNYINFLSDKDYFTQWNNYVLLGIDRKSEDIKALHPSVTDSDVKNWILYNRFYIKFIGVLNELVAQKVIERTTDNKLSKAGELLDTKYGVDFIDQNDNYYSVKSKVPTGLGLVYWENQERAFERDFPDKNFIKVITNTKYRVLKFAWNHKDELARKSIKY